MNASAESTTLPPATRYRIAPPAGPFHITNGPGGEGWTSIHVPGSKSLTNRALLIAALAEGDSTLENVLFSDDTRRMIEALQTLGFDLDIDEAASRVLVHGQDGHMPGAEADLFLGNAGTAMRFLTAACCLGRGACTLRGIDRMHQRPIGQLVEALRQLGANIEYLENEGFPPLRIRGGGLRGGRIHFPKAVSSQYVSALLLIAPCLSDGMTMHFDGPLTSRPYVEMTLKMMTAFGATGHYQGGPAPCIPVAGDTGYSRLSDVSGVPGDPRQQAKAYVIEPDASNASYFLAAAALTPGATCRIEGIGMASMQGDAWFETVLREMGVGVDLQDGSIQAVGPDALCGIDVSLDDMPDMAQTLAVIALFAKDKTTIRGIGNLRVKETDRIAAIKAECWKLGVTVEIHANDDITVTPPAEGVLRHPSGEPITREKPAIIETYDDHRMAMSFALAGLRQPGVVIDDPQCVNKTFPGYFDELRKLGATVEPVE